MIVEEKTPGVYTAGNAINRIICTVTSYLNLSIIKGWPVHDRH